MIISSLEQYASWYEKTKKIFTKREHIITNIESDGTNVNITMDFKGVKQTGEEVHIKDATISWQLVANNTSFKIKKYEIKGA